MADWDSWGATPSNPPVPKVSAGWDDAPTSAAHNQPVQPTSQAEPAHTPHSAPTVPSTYDSRPPAVKAEPPINGFNGSSSHTQPPFNASQPAPSSSGWNAVAPPINGYHTNPQQQFANGPLRSPPTSTSPNAIPANWGGVPPPTFSPGPRSSASYPSNGQHQTVPEPFQSNVTSTGWKPTAPTFVPRTQAGHPSQAEPVMSLNTFLTGAQGSKWAAENIQQPSFGPSVAARETMILSTTANTAGAGVQEQANTLPPPSFQQQSANPASTPTTTINGWTVTTSSSSIGTQGAPAPTSPTVPRSLAGTQQPNVTHNSVQSNGQGWNNAPSSSASNTSTHAFVNPASVGWKDRSSTVGVAPAQAAPEIHRGETPKPAFNQPYQGIHTGPAFNPALSGSQQSHERKVTHDSGWGDENSTKPIQSHGHDGVAAQGVPPTQPATVNGWIVAKPASSTMNSSRADPTVSLIQPMNNIQLANGNTSNQAEPHKIPGNTYSTHIPFVSNMICGPVPTGWQTSQPAPSTFTPAATNNGWTPRSFAGVPDQPQASSAAPAAASSQADSVTIESGSGWVTSPSQNNAIAPDQVPASSFNSAMNAISSGGIGWGDVPPQASAPTVSQAPALPVLQSTGGLSSDHKPVSTAPPSGGIGWGDAAIPPAAQPVTSNGNSGWKVTASTPKEDYYFQPDNRPSLNPAPASTGGIGWGDEPAQVNALPARSQPTGWGAPAPGPQASYNNYDSAPRTFSGDDSRSVHPSDSVSNVNGFDNRTAVNGNGRDTQASFSNNNNGYVSNGSTNGYGQNTQLNGHHAPSGASQGSWGAPRPDTFSNGGGGNGYSGGYGAPAERRFPGSGGSWASGPNEIPLRNNKWVSRCGGRPGEDVHRPVVPQAVPGSGW